jgi:hypothetical protein
MKSYRVFIDSAGKIIITANNRGGIAFLCKGGRKAAKDKK